MLYYGLKKNPYRGVIELSRKVALACTVCSSRNYTTNKNISVKAIRLEINKYCKKCGKHTLHSETK